jgi:membrane-associated phospholipid phosphatase
LTKIFIILFVIILLTPIFGQEQTDEQTSETEYTPAPLSTVFHNIGWNALHSITYNYGANMIGAGLGTLIFIETRLDWKWNRLAYNNEWMPKTGNYFNYVGYAVPALTPIALYVTGRAVKDEKLQITGLALTQSLALTMLIQTPLKIITGRTWPGIVDGWDSPLSKRSDRTDDYSDEFNWFNLDAIGGWPSGHTANAFAAAATIAHIYHENTALKAAVYTYASLIGLGMSIYDHWASDILAGALIGYAVGATVGKSFRGLTEKNEQKLTFYMTTNSMGVIIKLP